VKIFDRLGLLIRADAHGVMDRLEERSLLVRQHLRDAELALEHDRLRARALEEEARRLETSVRGLESRLAAIDADVELVLAGRLREREAAFASLRARARARLDALERRMPEADTEDATVADEEIDLELLRRRGVARPGGEASA